MIELSPSAALRPELTPEAGVALMVRDLRKSYDGTEILYGVSADIAQGEFTLIKGESGSGKSTFLKCVTGLEKIDEGMVVCGSTALHKYDMGDDLADVRRRAFGYVLQAPNLLGGLSIEQNIRMPYEIEDVELDDEWIQYVCERVGIHDKLNDKVGPTRLNTSWLRGLVRGGDTKNLSPHALSGGEQQRVAIARALAHKPEILVADEPTASLDSENTVKVHELLKSLVDQDGLTVMLVSHDSISSQYAKNENTITLHDGRIVG